MRNRFATLCTLVIASIIVVPAYAKQRAGTLQHLRRNRRRLRRDRISAASG